MSKESFVDREEKEHLQWHLDDIKKLHRKCKRNKIRFTREYALNNLWWTKGENADDLTIKMIDAVAKNGQKTYIDSMWHLPLYDRYREELLKTMVRYGYDLQKAKSWCFGWYRSTKDDYVKNLDVSDGE